MQNGYVEYVVRTVSETKISIIFHMHREHGVVIYVRGVCIVQYLIGVLVVSPNNQTKVRKIIYNFAVFVLNFVFAFIFLIFDIFDIHVTHATEQLATNVSQQISRIKFTLDRCV